MPIVDAQLHEPTLRRGWTRHPTELRYEAMTELELGYLDAAGVDSALLFPLELPWGEFAAREHPKRFSFVPMITDDGLSGSKSALDEDIAYYVAKKRENPGVVGMRILHTTSSVVNGGTGDSIRVHPIENFVGVFDACVREGLPLFMSTAHALAGPAWVAEHYPALTVVVDHLGMPQRPTFVRDDPPFAAIETLLALAELPNVVVKLSGVPTLTREAYPFSDLWPHLRRVIDAFGPRRLMWGSDISRVHGSAGITLNAPRGHQPFEGRHSYAEALLYIRESDQLSNDEKSWILGGTAVELLGLPDGQAHTGGQE